MKKKVFNIIQIGDKSNRLSRLFDIFIAIVICANILVTFLQTFDELAFLFPVFHVIEVITILIFCVEYVLRIWTADYLYPDKNELRSRLRFLISFDGIIDLLTILPFFFLSGMVIFRMLRVARIFHLFRLNARYDSFNVITTVLFEKRNQIISSVFIVLILMLASSLCMYSVEHDSQPEVFRNAFSGIWWSMSTLLTVGYGDIYPITTLGRIMAICIAYLGVGAVAIPTGIISAGFVEQYQRKSGLSNIKQTDIREIAEIFVDKRYAGKTVEEMEAAEQVTIFLILREDLSILPQKDTMLKLNHCHSWRESLTIEKTASFAGAVFIICDTYLASTVSVVSVATVSLSAVSASTFSVSVAVSVIVVSVASVLSVSSAVSSTSTRSSSV